MMQRKMENNKEIHCIFNTLIYLHTMHRIHRINIIVLVTGLKIVRKELDTRETFLF